MRSVVLLISAILLSAVLLTALPGCKKTAAGSTSGQKTIGLCLPSADHGWMGAVIEYAKEQAKESGVQYIVTSADNPAKQANDIDDLITRHVDAIVLLPVESAPLTPAAGKIKAAGIPLVLFDREINSDKFDVLVKGDNVGIGTNAGQYLADLLKGKGSVVEIQGVPCSVTDQRTRGFHDAMKKFPGIKIIASQPGDFKKEKSLTVMQNILQSKKQIDAVYTQDDEMALGVIQAIKEAKRTDIKIVTGAGGAKGVYQLIQTNDPLMKATFTYSPLMIKEAVKTAIDLANGKKPAQKVVTLPAEKITKDNVANYLKTDAPY
jgi:ribose transport system substrate-binding protein